jgi:hypothetical protein
MFDFIGNGAKEREGIREAMTFTKVKIDDGNHLDQVGNELKKGNIILCEFSDSVLQTSLDFTDGLMSVLPYKRLGITPTTFIFIPEKIIDQNNEELMDL